MITTQSISDLPAKPAVYALYGGAGRSSYVAYVGITGNLKNRITQHLVRRDSSVTTGTSAATLHADLITEVRWWRKGLGQGKISREAAEIIALEVLDPALRSRGRTRGDALKRARDRAFRARMEELFDGEPEGRLIIPDLLSAMGRISDLESRVRALELRIGKR